MTERCKISVKVVPGSSTNESAGWLGDYLKLRVMAKPEKGKANEAVIALLSDLLGATKSRIRVSSGHTSSRKTVAIEGMSRARAMQRLGRPPE